MVNWTSRVLQNSLKESWSVKGLFSSGNLFQPTTSREARSLSNLGQPIISSEARGFSYLGQPTISSEARGSRNLGQPTTSSGARGLRNLGQPTTSSGARGLRNLCQPIIGYFFRILLLIFITVFLMTTTWHLRVKMKNKYCSKDCLKVANIFHKN